uniref:Uncharacterized protein n=1 Tax=Arundo donax TaxID=35708 RepID=A0A0A9EHY8_ARUDO
MPTEGLTTGKGTAEAVPSVEFALDGLFGCDGTAEDESVAGEEINPFATRELRRLESGAAFSAICVDRQPTDGGGGRPGGKGGRAVFGVCVCKVVLSPAALSSDEEAAGGDVKLCESGPLGSRGCVLKLARSPGLFGLNPLFMRPANKLLALVRSELIVVESLGTETSPSWIEGLNSDGLFSCEKLGST